jgi:hypothetical protein
MVTWDNAIGPPANAAKRPRQPPQNFCRLPLDRECARVYSYNVHMFQYRLIFGFPAPFSHSPRPNGEPDVL